MGTLAEKFAKPPTPPPEAPPAPTPLADAFAEPSREVNAPTRGLTTDPLVLARMHKADAVYQQAREVGASEEEARRQSGDAYQTGMVVGDEADSAAVRSQLEAHEGPDTTGKMLTRAFGRGVMVTPLASPGKEERDRAYEQRVRENEAALGGLGAVGALASAVKGEKAEAAPLAQEQQSAWLRKALTESANWLAAKSTVAHGVSELWDVATGEPLFGEAPTTDELLTTLRQSSEEMKADPNMQALQLVPREGEVPGAQGVRVAGAGAMLAARALSKTPLGDVAGSLRKGLGLDEGETLLMWDDAQNREAFDQATADLYSGSGTRTAVDALPLRELPARLRGATIDIPAFQAAVAAGDPDLAPLQKAVGRGDDSWIGVIESLPVDVAARYQPDLRPTDDELNDAIKARHAAAKWSGAPQAAALENLMVAGFMKPLDNGKDALFVPSRFQDLMRVMAVPFAAVAIEPDIHPWTLVSGSPVDAPEQGDTSLTAKLRAMRIPTVRGVESLVESGAYNDWLASAGLFGGGDGYNAPLSGPSGYLARVLSDAAMGDYGARGYEDIYERAGGDPHSAVAKTLSTIDLALQFLIPAEDVVTVPMGATLRAGNRARVANRALRELGVPAKDARIAAVGSAIGPWVSSATDPIQALGDSTRTLIHDRFKSGELDPDALTPANLAGLKDLFVSVGVKDPDATLTGLLDHLRDRRMRVLDTAAEGLRTGGPQTRALRDSPAYKAVARQLTEMIRTAPEDTATLDRVAADMTKKYGAPENWPTADLANTDPAIVEKLATARATADVTNKAARDLEAQMSALQTQKPRDPRLLPEYTKRVDALTESLTKAQADAAQAEATVRALDEANDALRIHLAREQVAKGGGVGNFKNAAERDMALATLETDAFRAWDNGDIATPAEYFERQMWTKANPEEEAAEAAGREGLGEGTLYSNGPPQRPTLPEPAEGSASERWRLARRTFLGGAPEDVAALRAWDDAHPEWRAWAEYRQAVADYELRQQQAAAAATRDAEKQNAAARTASAKDGTVKLTKPERAANFDQWFGESVITDTGDTDGKPLLVSHETSAKFNEFRAGEFGFHFGVGIPEGMFGNRTIKGYLRMENPYRMRDLGVWTPEAVLREGPFDAADVSRLTSEVEAIRAANDAPTEKMVADARARGDTAQADKWQALIDDESEGAMFRDRRGNYLASQPVHQALRDLGYDGIVYANEAEGTGDSFIALDPTQFKSARNIGTYDPKDPNFLRSREGGTTRGSIEAVPRADVNPQGFYSALRRAVSDLKGERFTADQLRATLRNTPGVKADEIEWTRLDQFLADHQKPTKAEVVDWLDENAVVVEEKTLGASKKPDMPRIVETKEDADRVSIQLDPAVTDVGGTWELWKDPVDGDYGADRGRRGNPRWFATKEAAQDFIRNELADSWQRLAPEPADRTQYGNYQLPGGTNYREVLFKLPESDDATYRAPHFGDEGENLLAHMRVNDRIGPNGEKILHIEEIQSDWHQAGREKGYRGPDISEDEFWQNMGRQHGQDAVDRAKADFAKGAARAGRQHGVAGIEYDAIPIAAEIATTRNDAPVQAILSAYGEWHYPSADLPPSAPLSKTWHELALKRALRMAAEGGYDGVSWTRGVEQVKRYEDATRAAVDEVKWARPKQMGEAAERRFQDAVDAHQAADDEVGRLLEEGASEREVDAAIDVRDAAEAAVEAARSDVHAAEVAARSYRGGTSDVEVIGLKNGREVYRETMPPEKVADVLGKGMASKIMESPEASGSLTGPDLTIGGEGMRGFYDAKLRNDANKIVKPWGMRVGETTIRTGGGQRWVSGAGEGVTDATYTPVHYLPLTDAGKRAILTEGLPLFSREGGVTRGAITPVPTTKDVPNPARESWVAEGRAAAERVKALEKADAERLAQLEAKRDALRATPTQGAETPEWQAWKKATDERASLRTQKETLAKNPRAEDPEWAADLEDVTERLDAMPDPGPEPVRFAPGEAPPELLAAEQAVADFKPSPEYAAAVAELARMRKAPPTKSLTVPDRARWLIRLFKTGDILTAFHEGAHLAALMGPEWERMAARVFDSVDGKLTVKGHEQLAEASVRILRGKFRPGSVVDNLTQDVLDAVGDVWRRVRSKPFVEHVPQRMRRALDALPDNAIPAEFARMWDQQFSPERMATAEAVHIVDGQGRAFPAIVNVEDTPGARVLESKSSRAGQAQTATSIARNPEEVRVSLGLKAGEQSVDPVEFLSSAMAYLATERFRRAWGASGPLKMLPSGRTAVPEARHAKVIADADARRVAAMGGRPSPIQGTNDLALTPGQQAGLRRVVREVADSPLGDALPASLTEPGADLSRIAAEDYNTLTALHTDLSAGWGAWRETRAERAATSGATRILTAATDYARKTDAKPAIDSVQRAFDSSFGVNEAMQPHQAEFMRSIQRELAAVPAQVDAAIAQTAQEWRKGGTKFKAIDLVRETAKGIPPEVVPPDYVDDLAQVEPLLLNGTLEGVAASAEQIDNLFAKTPLDDSAGDMRIIESDAVRRLDDLHRAFMETNDMEAALAATGETPRSASDAMQIVTEGIRRRSASVQDIGRDITLTFFGSNDLTGVEKLQDPAVRAQVFRNNYVRWFEGDWVGILDDIESMRGGVSGQKYDQGSAALSVTIRLNARKVLRDAAGRMAAAGLTGDVANMARNRGGKGVYTAGKLAQGLEAFQADVASYIATISGWTVGQQGFVDDAGQFVTLGGAGRRTARGVEDPVAYDEACRQMARFGVKPTNVTSWDAMDMPGGGRILAPRFVLDNIKTVLEESAPLDLARKERLSFDPRVGDIVPGSAAQRPPTADVKAINAGIYVLNRMWGYSGAMLRRGLLTGIGPIVKPAYFVTQFVGGINALHQRLGTVGALRVLASPVIGGSDATVVRNVMARLYGPPDILSPTVAGFWTKDGRWITDQMISADMARSGMVTSQPKAEFTTSLIENIAAQEPTAWNNLNRLRLPGTRAWREMVDNAATGIDNMYRVATYVDALKSGVAVEEAGRIARDVAYDFNDLTDFEKKYMRKAVLFYTFQRRNQDAFWRTLLNNPARLTGELRLLNGLQRQELGEDSEIYANPYGDGRLALRFRDALVEGHAANAQRGALTISPGLNVGDQVGLWLDILGTAGGLLHGEVDRASVGRLTGRLAPGLQAIPAAAGFDVERMRLLEDTPATVPQVVVDTDYALSSLFTTYDDEMLGGALTRDVFQARPVRPWDDADAPTGSGLVYEVNRKDPGAAFCWWAFNNLVPYGAVATQAQNYERAAGVIAPRAGVTQGEEAAGLFGFRTTPVQSRAKVLGGLIDRRAKELEDEARAAEAATIVGPRE